MPADISTALPMPAGGVSLPGSSRGKRSWRDFLRTSLSQAGLILAIVALAICATVGFQRLIREQQVSKGEQGIDTWLVAQLELEFLRFQNAVDAYANPLSKFDRDSMLEREDIFWSRLPVVIEGNEGARLRAIPHFV